MWRLVRQGRWIVCSSRSPTNSSSSEGLPLAGLQGIKITTGRGRRKRVMQQQGAVNAQREQLPAVDVQVGHYRCWTASPWNHPVIAQGQLFVRQAEKRACYLLRAKGQSSSAAGRSDYG